MMSVLEIMAWLGDCRGTTWICVRGYVVEQRGSAGVYRQGHVADVLGEYVRVCLSARMCVTRRELSALEIVSLCVSLFILCCR